MDEKLKDLEHKIDTLSTFTKESIDVLSGYLSLLTKKFAQYDLHFKLIEKELTLIKAEIKNLDGTTSTGFDAVEIQMDNIVDKIDQIQKVSGFEEQFNNMKTLG